MLNDEVDRVGNVTDTIVVNPRQHHLVATPHETLSTSFISNLISTRELGLNQSAIVVGVQYQNLVHN